MWKVEMTTFHMKTPARIATVRFLVTQNCEKRVYQLLIRNWFNKKEDFLYLKASDLTLALYLYTYLVLIKVDSCQEPVDAVDHVAGGNLTVAQCLLQIIERPAGEN